MPKTNCRIRTDIESFDLDMICDFIQHSYWGEGRSGARILACFENSFCFGAFVDAKQVGFARVVSDQAFQAYIFDLFVVESHRGRSVAQALMDAILTHERLRDVTGFMLSTREAHGLYEKFGFVTASDPTRYMIRAQPEPPR